MGCVNSKKDINDLHPNVFQVCNVDEQGNKVSSGQLEVNEVELILHQKGVPPVRWPLRSLRRYGRDGDRQVFSFEAGRRCPTGSGTYAFNCRRAERLFNCVQAHMQQRNSEEGSREFSGSCCSRMGEPPYLEPTPLRPRLGTLNGPGSRLSSVGSSNGFPSPSTPLQSNNNYANEEMFKYEELSRSGEEEEEGEPTPSYMNLSLGAQDEEGRCYANMTIGYVVPRVVTPGPAQTPLKEMHYAVLDLDDTVPPSPSSQLFESPTPKSYSTIDFDKTVALSNSTRPQEPPVSAEPRPHKRHDSTFSLLFSSKRNSACLTE